MYSILFIIVTFSSTQKESLQLQIDDYLNNIKSQVFFVFQRNLIQYA